MFAVLVHAIAVAVSLPVSAKVVYNEKTVRFDLGYDLKTKRDVWKSIGRNGPVSNGRHAIGTASGRINYKFRTKRSRGHCSVKEALFDVRVKIKLPEWQQSYLARQNVKDFYGCVLRTVTIHEKRHAEIWVETAQKMEDAFLYELRGVRCDRIKAEARSVYRRIYKQSRQRQSAFDAADKKRRRYQRCWRGKRNHKTVASLPQVSGRTPWSKRTASRRNGAQTSSSSRRSRQRPQQTSQRVQPQANSQPRALRVSAKSRSTQPAPSEHWFLEPAARLAQVVGWLFLTVVAIAGGFFAIVQKRLWLTNSWDLDEPEVASEDWRKRAFGAVSERANNEP